VKIVVPDSIRSLEPALAEFFDGMVHKLHVNSYKNALTGDDVPSLIAKMLEELTEFQDQLTKDRTDLNVLAETWDGANFWFLLYAFLRQEGVATERERFIAEYFDIQTDLGKVFCTKTRSGSKYRPGDEVLGTKNSKGEVLIRTQNAAGGFAVTLLRSHLVWWEATGTWPQDLRRINGNPEDDSIGNLYQPFVESELPKTFPFVYQYAPVGREQTENYGKWVYRRRHLFKLVSCGYYDTEDQAAREGLKAWKAKVEESREKKVV